MANRNLAPEKLQRFLDRPLVATLATYRKDGSVLLSPVWQEWQNGGFNIVIGQDDVKARHIKRDPRASVAVYEHAPPYTGVELRTTASMTAGDGHDLLRRLAVRYLGNRAGNKYADTSADDPMVVLRLKPGELRSWNYADEF